MSNGVRVDETLEKRVTEGFEQSRKIKKLASESKAERPEMGTKGPRVTKLSRGDGIESYVKGRPGKARRTESVFWVQ